ncbi:hypothetical protein [Nocardiopsis listeri]|uniref:hypothetical protein n=1 Tax=Nocardiopsis listeri TaxID=53440 RepID=UPI00082CD1D8|nr:hypothetical protein [Nocardiopsis listeri]
MPGFEHELQVRLLQNRPELVPLMLRDTIGFPVPDFAHAELGCGDHTRLKPKSFKSDNVVVLYDESGRKVLAIVSEVQQGRDDDKPYTWPLYLATVREQLRCPVRLMIVCPDIGTERWARHPIEIETGGATLRPAVLGPGNTPYIDDLEKARAFPELAVLSAAAHGSHLPVLKAAEAALDKLPEHTQLLYNDYIESKLNAAARKMWEDLMATGTYEWQSDFARKYVGQGREEGRQEGREEGRAEGKQETLIRFLEATSATISLDSRRRIEECDDIGRLDDWLDKAFKSRITDADELFD